MRLLADSAAAPGASTAFVALVERMLEATICTVMFRAKLEARVVVAADG